MGDKWGVINLVLTTINSHLKVQFHHQSIQSFK
jgi:hypothetical protein